MSPRNSTKQTIIRKPNWHGHRALSTPANETRFAIEPLEDRSVPAVFNLVAGVADGVAGSLREAITMANSNSADDTINLGAGTFMLTLAGADEDNNIVGDLDLRESGFSVTIQGAGAGSTTIDATGLGDRLLDVFPSVELVLDGVTITGGNVFGSTGGGLLNQGGMIDILNSTITGNQSNTDGGGIFNFGTLVVSNSTISGNTSTGGSGGGIYNSTSSNLVVSDSTISGNNSSGFGGGIQNLGTTTISNTAITGNMGDQFGGGISNFGTGSVTVINSTISGNIVTAPSSEGGGIFTSTGSVDLYNSTVASNTAYRGGGVANAGSVTSESSIFAENTATSSMGPDLFDAGTITITDSLIENANGHTITNGVNGNIVGTDPMLGPLQNNGGPTDTHALTAGSAAIDAGSNPLSLLTDQRGASFLRSVGLGTDIGAYEMQSSVCTVTAVLSGSDLIITGCPDDNVIEVSMISPGFIDVFAEGMFIGDFMGVSRIVVSAGDGNDEVTIDSSISLPTSLDGGAGDDTLIGGAGLDTLLGGTGNDVHEGNGNNDTYILNNDFGADVINESDPDNFIIFAGSATISVEFGTDFGEPVEFDNRLTIDSEFFQFGQSGSGDDFFVLAGNAMPGDRDGLQVDGGGGIDTFIYLNFNAPVLVDAGTGFATGWGLFENFEQVLPNPNQQTEVMGLDIIGEGDLDGTITFVGLESTDPSAAQSTGDSNDLLGTSTGSVANESAVDSNTRRPHLGGGTSSGSAQDTTEEQQQVTEEEVIDAVFAAGASADDDLDEDSP